MALPIGAGQTISQPYMVARIAEELGLDGDERVDVGTGSGYQAALLAGSPTRCIRSSAFSELAEQAKANLAAAGFENVAVYVGDGSRGLPEQAPFDAIAVAAAAPTFPQALYEQLRPGGASRRAHRRPPWPGLGVIVHSPEGPTVIRSVPCRFVPLVGEEVRGLSRRRRLRCLLQPVRACPCGRLK